MSYHDVSGGNIGGGASWAESQCRLTKKGGHEQTFHGSQPMCLAEVACDFKRMDHRSFDADNVITGVLDVYIQVYHTTGVLTPHHHMRTINASNHGRPLIIY